MRSESDLYKKNLFGLLRLVLASAVVFGHVWVANHWLTGTWDPIATLGIRDMGSGQVAVVGFFSISGFLISGSSRRNPSNSFAILRAGRLLPGYWLMLVIVTVFLEPILFFLVHGTLVGIPVFGRQSLVTYFVKNLFVVQFQNSVPGTFVRGMDTHVNGSVWSLQYEILCYFIAGLMVWIGRRIGGLFSRWVPYATIAFTMFLIRLLLSAKILDYHLTFVLIPLSVYLGAFFLSYTVGCFSARWLTHTATRISVPAVILLLVAVGMWNIWGEFLFPIAVLVFGSFAGGRKSSMIGRDVDLSYGIFLFGWPIQQMLSSRHVFVHDPYLSFLAALVLVVPLAMFSWFVVERPCLRMAHRWAGELRERWRTPQISGTSDLSGGTGPGVGHGGSPV
jgi:peptidoglycan/LPS O-acetylase OafA/YrhL